jgi:hypothetical protein
VSQRLSSPDVADSNIAHVPVPEGTPSTISDTMTLHLPGEAIGGATISILESAMGAYTQDSSQFIHGSLDQDAIFTDFEAFTQDLFDESLSQGEPIVNSSGQRNTVPLSHTPDLYLTKSNEWDYSYASQRPQQSDPSHFWPWDGSVYRPIVRDYRPALTPIRTLRDTG